MINVSLNNPILIVASIVFILFIGLLLFFVYRKFKANKIIVKKLNELNIGTIETNKDKTFDLKITTENKVILVKIIYHFNKAEINVNSKNYWQINRGVVSSRKKGEKMKNVYSLLQYDYKKNGYPKDTIRLHIIYPSSVRLIKVLNECEMAFINEKTDIYGTRIIPFNEIDNILNII